jgi:hypothetical protein
MMTAGCARTIAPYFDLRRALWIPAVLVWGETTCWGVEGPEGFEEYERGWFAD